MLVVSVGLRTLTAVEIGTLMRYNLLMRIVVMMMVEVAESLGGREGVGKLTIFTD